MNLSFKKINIIKKLIINLMNVDEDEIGIIRKRNIYEKDEKKRLNVIVGNNQTRINVLINCIFEKKEIFLIFSNHNQIFFRKVTWSDKNFLFFFLNLRYEIISTIYKKNY
tara:strand:- start:57 stop:386 length:330 start_codon:yes stop_codon:yes gene_type:complete